MEKSPGEAGMLHCPGAVCEVCESAAVFCALGPY